MAAATGIPPGAKTYTGHGRPGDLSDPNNWSGGTRGTAAGASDFALIPTNAVINGAFSARILMMLGNEQVTVNGALSTLSPGLCISFMVCDGASATFTPTSSLNDAGGIVIGNDNIGNLLAQGSAAGVHSTLTTVSAKIGQNIGGIGTATIDGAVWNNSQNFYVGQQGQGTLNVLDGGRVSVGTTFVVGEAPGITGAVHLSSGAQLLVAGSSRIAVGDVTNTAGTGSVSVGAGSLYATTGSMKIGLHGSVNLSGGTVTVGDAATGLQVWAGGAISGFGTVSAIAGGINDYGTVTASGGTLVVNAAVSGGGQIDIAGSSTVQLTASKIGVAKIAFTGSNGTLALAHGATVYSVISGFAAGDTISMAGVDQIGWNSTTDLLTLSSGGHVVDTLHFAGTYASDAFVLSQNSAGALITLNTHSTAGVHI